MKFTRHLASVVAAVIMAVICPATASAQSTVSDNIANVPVYDQNGNRHYFYEDMIRDKLVAINFIFTRCEMICPMSGFKFGQVRKAVSDNGDTRLELISVTTDAGYDSAERLKAWAGRFDSGPGWSQVTGDKLDMDGLLKSIRAYTADKLDHTSMILLVNDRLNRHKWIDGNSSVESILIAARDW